MINENGWEGGRNMTQPVFDNTPAILFAFGQAMGLFFYVFQNPLRRSKARTALLSLPFLTVYVLVGYLTGERSMLLFWPVYVCQFLLGAFMLWFLCRIPKMNAAYFCLRAFLLGEMATSLQWQLNRFFRTYFPGFPIHPAVIMIAVFGVAFAISWHCEHPHLEEHGELPIRRRNLFSMTLIFLFTVGMGNFSYLPFNNPFRVQSSWDLFSLRTVAYMGGVGISLMYHMQLLETERRITAEKLHAMTLMQYNCYKVNENSIALVNQKYHDLKHQLHWLRNSTYSEEKQKALDKLESEIRVYENQLDTGNKVLDAILTAATQAAQEKQVAMHCLVDGSALDFLPAMDLCALVGNAVDNAIEAAARMPQPEDRRVDVSLDRHLNFARLNIRNPYQGKLKLENGIPLTTKNDDRYHGFGVRSIRSIVQKYDGSLSVSSENNLYELKILFSIPE